MIWAKDVQNLLQDYYVAFRGVFTLDKQTTIETRTCGASWFVVWLDGAYLVEGPARFEPERPEYDTTRITLPAGRHVFAVQAHHIGVTTRILDAMPPFLYCHAFDANECEIPIVWRCARLQGYAPAVRRINAQLGWIEWCDTRLNPAGWTEPDFNDAEWKEPAPTGRRIEMGPTRIAAIEQFRHNLRPSSKGKLAECFGYERDDVPARFFLRDLEPANTPAQGVWRRYDLGQVRLGRPSFTLDVPEGAIVEFAYAEQMYHGRVAPYITLSGSDSCNLDHYVARGGIQIFEPLTPKGGRYLEIHVLADPEAIGFIYEDYLERSYFGEADGAFFCDDPLLDRIWQTGVNTLRACAEDAVIDNPTRERGQWTGDVVTVGMDIAAAAFSDLRLLRRGLVQSALSARDDGLVAGMSPDGDIYVTTYAAQWFTACVHYYQLTGDRTVLEELYPYALANLSAFRQHETAQGLLDSLGWTFVDWGYARNDGPADIALSLHYLAGLRSMREWSLILGKNDALEHCGAASVLVEKAVRAWFDETLAGEAGWQAVGYHAAVLGLSLGFLQGKRRAEAVAYIKQHILSCFPNREEAPRTSDPGFTSRQVITPYFAHYAFPPLIEAGEMDFVLDQYRLCWGYALDQDRTTWIEVFDPRWSHCHQWSGCPTWQLSRYVLGLWNRRDWGTNHFQFKFAPGSLKRAQGAIPLIGEGDVVEVAWHRTATGRTYTLRTERPIWVHNLPGHLDSPLEVKRELTLDLG